MFHSNSRTLQTVMLLRVAQLNKSHSTPASDSATAGARPLPNLLVITQANAELQGRLQALQGQPSPLALVQAQREENVKDRSKFNALLENLQVTEIQCAPCNMQNPMSMRRAVAAAFQRHCQPHWSLQHGSS